MNKAEWLRQLEKELHKLPQKEREDAIEYYREYLDEAGPENEAEVLKGFGTPSKVASEIKADYAVTRLEEDDRNKQKPKMKWILLAILGGIVSAPVTMPIMIALITIAFVGIICAFALIIALAACAIAGVGAGIVVLFFGFKTLAVGSGMGSLLGIGCGLMIVALMVLASLGVFILTKKFIKFVSRKIREKDAAKKAKKGTSFNEELHIAAGNKNFKDLSSKAIGEIKESADDMQGAKNRDMGSTGETQDTQSKGGGSVGEAQDTKNISVGSTDDSQDVNSKEGEIK